MIVLAINLRNKKNESLVLCLGLSLVDRLLIASDHVPLLQPSVVQAEQDGEVKSMPYQGGEEVKNNLC